MARREPPAARRLHGRTARSRNGDTMTETALVVADPRTGEVIDLPAAKPEYLARLVEDIRDLESRLRETKQLVSFELHRRMDLERSWTIDAGDYKISGKSDAL